MTVCQGCGGELPNLPPDAGGCTRCHKLSVLGLSEPEKKTIMDTAQCQGCGVIFLFLTGPNCGRCIKASQPAPHNPGTAGVMMSELVHRTHNLEEASHGLRTGVPSPINTVLNRAHDLNHQTQAVKCVLHNDSLRVKLLVVLCRLGKSTLQDLHIPCIEQQIQHDADTQ
ncbi:hypothetical protein M422DRAFT_243842 [Sphaerobolus stellatus SS14]|nr:hypothetical protein M422DRAFT_243842 [Sphaerobolus stellatus SS14]